MHSQGHLESNVQHLFILRERVLQLTLNGISVRELVYQDRTVNFGVSGFVFAVFLGSVTPGHRDSLESDSTRHRDESVCLRGDSFSWIPAGISENHRTILAKTWEIKMRSCLPHR